MVMLAGNGDEPCDTTATPSAGSPGRSQPQRPWFPLQGRAVHGFATIPSTPNPTTIMKHPSLAMASAIGLICLTLGSCNPQDPSAVRETQKMIAEAAAKASRLEQENASLKSQIEDLQKQVTAAKTTPETTTKKGFSEEELDKKLGATLSNLHDQLAAMDRKIDLLKAVAEKSVAIGEDRARNAPVAANPPSPRSNPTPATPATPANVQPRPTPAPAKPKYDIQLNNPVMGPANH